MVCVLVGSVKYVGSPGCAYCPAVPETVTLDSETDILSLCTLSVRSITSRALLDESVAIAATRIRGGVVRSPVTHSYWLSQLCGCDVFLKHEQFQFTGSFKERGARNALMSLSEEKKAKGVVAACAGVLVESGFCVDET